VVCYVVLGHNFGPENTAVSPGAAAPGFDQSYATATMPATAPVMGNVFGSNAPRFGYGLTRTDEVPVYAQNQPMQPMPSPMPPPMPPHRSTPIDALFANDNDHARGAPIPLVIRPLDLPSSRDVLFPLTSPGIPTDER